MDSPHQHFDFELRIPLASVTRQVTHKGFSVDDVLTGVMDEGNQPFAVSGGYDSFQSRPSAHHRPHEHGFDHECA